MNDPETLLRLTGYALDWMFLIAPPTALAVLAWRLAR
jgi:hypothetical protein